MAAKSKERHGHGVGAAELTGENSIEYWGCYEARRNWTRGEVADKICGQTSRRWKLTVLKAAIRSTGERRERIWKLITKQKDRACKGKKYRFDLTRCET